MRMEEVTLCFQLLQYKITFLGEFFLSKSSRKVPADLFFVFTDTM